MVSVGRSDFGIYLPLLRELSSRSGVDLQVYAAGMHLSERHGSTWRMVEEHGFALAARVDYGLAGDEPADISAAMGRGMAAFAPVYRDLKPDIVVVLGDRFDMFAAAAAAVPLRLPIAHLHGGEVTRGAIDDVFRHAITKMSHLHFVSTEPYARRVMQMGEEPWRVVVSGAPSLDNLRSVEMLDRRALEARLGFALDPEFLLVTFHPVTMQYEDTDVQVRTLIAALLETGMQVVWTLPNADTRGSVIDREMRAAASTHSRLKLVDNLGTQAYFSAMKLATAMVGNSSSGIIEAASFELPVVDVGIRQGGRLKPRNVLETPCEVSPLRAAIRRATSREFRESLKGLSNPYGDGHAAPRIADKLMSTPLDHKLTTKVFREIPGDGVS